MRYPIAEGWMVDKNELPELFGPATTMWVLAASEQPDVTLLCYPRHMDGPVPGDVVAALGLDPGDCFWRIAKVEIKATQEMVVREQKLAKDGGAETTAAIGPPDQDWRDYCPPHARLATWIKSQLDEDVCHAWHLRDGSYVLVREDEGEAE